MEYGRRQQFIIDTIKENKISNILEIGVHNGNFASHMIDTARRQSKKVTYYGFDLFEDITKENHDREFAKWPPPEDEVYKKLTRYDETTVVLHKGLTSDTLPSFLEKGPPDNIALIFIDGGHSQETMLNDWLFAKHYMHQINNEVFVFFDEYNYFYDTNRTRQWACQFIVEDLDDKTYSVEISPDEDTHDWGTAKIAKIKLK